ncbi:unnamed protein product [Dicrocoelium dendriticum]|nr:unnamed protein product [Dicrocoelium dendriticum]
MADLLRCNKPSFHSPEDVKVAFEKLKDPVSNITLFADPDPATQISLTTDTSDTAVDEVIQQLTHHSWIPRFLFLNVYNPRNRVTAHLVRNY